MKKMILSAGIALLSITASFATTTGEPVNAKVKYNFDKAFSGANHITWSQVKGEDIYKASFEYNNEKVEAFYNADGVLLASGRYITSRQLPLAVAQSIKENYSAYAVAPEVIEFSDGNETAYYVRLDILSQTLTIKASANGDLSVFKKEKRKLPA
jgi:hypothetical protein